MLAGSVPGVGFTRWLVIVDSDRRNPQWGRLTFKRHVKDFAWSPTAPKIAFWAETCVYIACALSGAIERHVCLGGRLEEMAWHPAGARLAIGDQGKKINGRREGRLRIWDLDTDVVSDVVAMRVMHGLLWFP